ncbi:MAG: tetratricopeptide repeat protein [Acidobacteria bacterium]|nr:tetratricopeptide repeat protein [Acidobacteriota bacterium]
MIALGWLALILIAAPEEDAAARSERAARAMLDERFAEAETLYLELVRADPGNPGLLLNLGLAQQSLGKQREAADRFRAVAKLQPGMPLAWFLLGVAEHKLGRPAEALQPLERVLEIEPAHHAAALELAEALFDLGRYEAAATRFYRVVETEPGSLRGWQALGTSYILLARRALGEVPPESAWWWALMGRERAEAGRLEVASAFYREALAKDPKLYGAHAALAGLYSAAGHDDWARAELEREEQLPEPDCTQETPECELRNQRYWQAVEAAGKLSGPRAAYWKARACYELANVAFARLAEAPVSEEFHERLAETHRLLGRHAAAVKSWEEALTLTPGDRDLERQLAQSLFDARDYLSARRLLERLVAAEPDSPELNWLFGQTLQALGQGERAEAYLKKGRAPASKPPLPPRAQALENQTRLKR